MVDSNEAKLISIIGQQDWLVDVLKDVRDLRLPDWYVAAGAIRNSVWNYLHNFPTDTHQRDIDVAYFDPANMGSTQDKILERILKEKLPNLKWDVFNQARAHLFKHYQISRPPAKSSCESISYWSEIPTCVGIRLEQDDSFTICAPYGLDDLMNLVVRPIPKPKQNLALYQKRVGEKQWAKFWPKLRIEHPAL